MKLSKYISLRVLASTILAALLLVFIYVVVFLKIDNSDNFKTIDFKNDNSCDYASIIINSDTSNLQKSFPYKDYIKCAKWWDFNTLNSTLTLMDSTFKNKPEANEYIIIACLTDSLLQRYYGVENIDSLNALLIIAEKYATLSEAGLNHSFVLWALSDIWIEFISKKIAEQVKTNSSLKYSFKYRYIKTRCSNYQHPPNFGNSKFEKVVINFVEGDWYYLFVERYWKTTSLVIKAITLIPLFILITLFVYGCICIFQKHSK